MKYFSSSIFIFAAALSCTRTDDRKSMFQKSPDDIAQLVRFSLLLVKLFLGEIFFSFGSLFFSATPLLYEGADEDKLLPGCWLETKIK